MSGEVKVVGTVGSFEGARASAIFVCIRTTQCVFKLFLFLKELNKVGDPQLELAIRDPDICVNQVVFVSARENKQ